MGFLGSARGLTPNLDALARDGIVFTRAFSQAPITTVSHATLLTGTFPPAHRVSDFGAALQPGIPYLPQLFHDAGYRTAAFVGSLILDPRNGTAPGFDRGFDVYDAGFRLQRPGETRYATVERRGDDVAARAVRWITERRATSNEQRATSNQPPAPSPQPPVPWFVWAHLFDAHDPYDPPADLKARFQTSLYDGEIAAVDRAAGRLIQAAGTNTIVVVAADHGEALGDHGEDTHGVFLYDAVLHVPLVIRLPWVPVVSGVSRTSRVTTQVRLADVAPTVLETAGLSVPSAIQGESLMPLVRLKPDTTGTTRTNSQAPVTNTQASVVSGFSRTVADRPVYAETDYPRQAFGWSPLAAWRADRFLLVRAPRPELYDVVSDAAATRNLAATRARVVDGMSAELREFIVRAGLSTDLSAGAQSAKAEARSAKVDGAGRSGRAGGAEKTETTKVDPELAQRLAALGYVSGSGTTANTGIDPKDRISIANDLHRAVVLVDAGAFAKAIPLLEKVTASEPNIPLAQLQLGAARARQKQYAQAIAPLQKAVALEPGQTTAQYELGMALYETGDLRGAATHFAIVASKLPKFADARYSLGSVYARIDRVPEAVTELRAALDLEPRHFRANLLLGRILTLQNRADAALPYLRTAIEVDPRSTEARAFLADALKKP